MKLIFLYILTVFSATLFLPQANRTVDSLLAEPFDLQKFKNTKGQSNSGGGTKEPYYFKPGYKGIYYGFFLFRPMSGYIGEIPNNDIHSENGLYILTYKPLGKYQYEYFDPTETLIEVVEHFNDNDLPELAFVGLDTVKIKKKLGSDFLRKDNCFIYTKDKSALTLKISGKTVLWLKYTRLNFALTKDNIPEGLLRDN